METVIRIADYFKVPIDYLLEIKSINNINFKLPEDEYLLIGDLSAESKKELRRFLELFRKAEKSDQKHE